MEKKKYQNPTMEEIEVKEQLFVCKSQEIPDEGGSNSRSASSFDDAE